MKALVVSQARYGVHTVLDEVLPSLVNAHEWEVTYATVPTNPVPEGCESVHVLDERWIQRSERATLFFLLYHVLEFWRRAHRFISRHGHEYDVVWLHNPRLLFLAEDMDHMLITYHSRLLRRKADQHPGIRQIYYRLFGAVERRAIQSLSNSSFTVVDESIQDDLSNLRVNDDRVSVIHNGVDTDRFRPPADKTQHKATWSFDDETVFLYVGRLHPSKRPRDIIPLFERIDDMLDDDCRLVFAGDGPEVDTIVTSIQENDRQNIEYLGYVEYDAIPYLYRAGDYFFLPSQTDPGGPLTLYEALASGVPAIASKDLLTTEFLERAECGVRVDYAEPDTAARVALSMIEDSHSKYTERARAYALNHLRWEDKVQEYNTVLQRAQDNSTDDRFE